MESERLLLYKLAVENGFLSPEALEQKLLENLEAQEVPDNDIIELLLCKKSAKALSVRISDLLADAYFDITPQRLEKAARGIGIPIGNAYQLGKLTLAEACNYFGRLGRYCWEYSMIAEEYDLYVEGIASSIYDLRRALDHTLGVHTTEIPLASIETMQDGVLYYRDNRHDLLPLDLEVCKEGFAKNAALHPDEYPQYDSQKPYAAEVCWNSFQVFLLFHTPQKIYFTAQRRSFAERFLRCSTVRQNYIMFQMIKEGYCIYDLQKRGQWSGDRLRQM